METQRPRAVEKLWGFSLGFGRNRANAQRELSCSPPEIINAHGSLLYAAVFVESGAGLSRKSRKSRPLYA